MHLLKQFVASGMVIGLAVCCCWGYLNNSADFSLEETTALPRLGAEKMRPQLRPFGSRDPFLVLSSAPQTGEETDPLPEPDQERPPELRLDPRELLATLRLEATLLLDERRVAVVNQRTYTEGDTLVVAGFESMECRVLKIRNDAVLLQIDDKTFALRYPGFAGSHFVPIDSPVGPRNAPSTARESSYLPQSIRKLFSWGTGLPASRGPAESPTHPDAQLTPQAPGSTP